MKLTTPLLALALSGLLIAACGLITPNRPPKLPAGPRLSVNPDGSLWRYDAAAGDRMLAATNQFEKVTADAGDTDTFLTLDDGPAQTLHVWQCDAAGTIGRDFTLAGEGIADATAILEAHALPPGQLFVVLHIGPESDPRFIIDLASQTVQVGPVPDAASEYAAYLHGSSRNVLP